METTNLNLFMSEIQVDLSQYHNVFGRKHQLIRILWCLVWTLCARWLPRSVGSSRKCCFLRLFGAQIAPTAVIYSSAKVCFPANLAIKAYSCLASDINCYNVALIKIGANTTISQDDYLCTTSHDISGAFQLSNYRSYHH